MTAFDLITNIMVIVMIGITAYFIYTTAKTQTELFKQGDEAKVGALDKLASAIENLTFDNELKTIEKLLGTSSWTSHFRSGDVSLDAMVNYLTGMCDKVTVYRCIRGTFGLDAIVSVTLESITHVLKFECHWVKAGEYQTEKFDIDTWVNSDGLMLISDQVEICVPHIECDTVCLNGLLEIIKEGRELSTLSRIQPVKQRSQIEIYELVQSGDKLKFTNVPYSIRECDTPTLNLSFNPMEIKLGSDKFNVPAGEAVEFFAKQLIEGRNVMFIGETGRGKTVLSSNVVKVALGDDNIVVIRVDFVTLKSLTTPAGKALFQQFCSEMVALGKTGVIMYLDEGQAIAHSKEVTPLLEFMEGLTISRLRVSVMISVSAKSETDLDPALVRPGRVHELHVIKELEKNKAIALKNHIMRHTDLVLNPDQLNEYLKNGRTSLANVWASFTPKAQVDEWREKFYVYKSNKQVVQGK